MTKRAVSYLLIFAIGLGAGLCMDLVFDNGETTNYVESNLAPLPTIIPDAPPVRMAKKIPVQEATNVTTQEKGKILQSVIDVISTPTIQVGTGVITGTVKTKDGKPVHGVTILAWENQQATKKSRKITRKAGGPPSEQDLEAMIRDLVAQTKWSRAGKREAQSTDDGSYYLNGLGKAEYKVRAYKEGYMIRPGSNQKSNAVKPGGSVNFVAHAIINLPVTLTLPDGSSPKDGQIIVKNGRSSSWEQWSSSSPTLELTPGSYDMTAQAGDDKEFKSETQSITLVAGTEPKDLVFHLKGRPGLKGIVYFPDGEEPNHCRVSAIPSSGTGPVDLKKIHNDDLHMSANSAYVRKTDGEYKYSLTDLEPGNYIIVAGRSYQSIDVGERVNIVDQVVTMDLRIPELDPADYVVVTVLGPGGVRLTDVDFSTRAQSDGSSSSGGSTVVGGANGVYKIAHHGGSEYADDPDTTYTVTAQSKKYGNQSESYKRGETNELTITFADPGTLEVTVTGVIGTPYEGRVKVSLVDKTKKDRRYRSHSYWSNDEKKMGADGKITMGPLNPGEYEIGLGIKEGGRRRYNFQTVAKQTISLSAGMNSVSLAMPTLYSVTIMTDAKKGSQITLRADGKNDDGMSFNNYKKVNKEGNATFDTLPAGNYQVQMWGGSSQGSMKISLPGPASVQFKAKAINALKVTISDTNGFYGKAGFKSGDLVIGMNGTEFVDQNQMQTLMAGMMNQETINWIVLRGGTRLNLEVNMKDMMAAGGNGGGHMLPSTR